MNCVKARQAHNAQRPEGESNPPHVRFASCSVPTSPPGLEPHDRIELTSTVYKTAALPLS